MLVLCCKKQLKQLNNQIDFIATENRPLEVVKTGSGYSPMPLGSGYKFVRYEHWESGYTALSLTMP